MRFYSMKYVFRNFNGSEIIKIKQNIQYQANKGKWNDKALTIRQVCHFKHKANFKNFSTKGAISNKH